MILFGWVTNTSITALFLAPIVPGIPLVGLYCVVNRVLTGHMPIAVPEPVPVREFTENVADKGRRASVDLLLPVLSGGCIYGGLTTPMAGADVGVAFAIQV